MDNVLKIAVAVAIFLAGGGVFYHYVIYLPGIESAKQEQLAAEKKAAAEKESGKKAAYEQCLASANANYNVNWANACQSVAEETEEKRKNCLADPAIVNNQFMGVAYCRSTFSPTDPSPNCTLPGGRSGTINGYAAAAKQKCMAEAQAGL